MARLTVKEKAGYILSEGTTLQEALQRLGAFEDYYEALLAGQKRYAEELETLRNQGKKNTVKFRQALGTKMIDANIISHLKTMYGIEI